MQSQQAQQLSHSLTHSSASISRTRCTSCCSKCQQSRTSHAWHASDARLEKCHLASCKWQSMQSVLVRVLSAERGTHELCATLLFFEATPTQINMNPTPTACPMTKIPSAVQKPRRRRAGGWFGLGQCFQAFAVTPIGEKTLAFFSGSQVFSRFPLHPNKPKMVARTFTATPRKLKRVLRINR